MRKLRKVLDKEPYVAFYSCSLSDTGLRTCLWESLDQVNWVAVTHLGCRWHHSQAQGLWVKSELSAASWLWKQSEQLGVSSFSAAMTLLPWWTWILNQNKPFLKLNLQTCCSSNAESDKKKVLSWGGVLGWCLRAVRKEVVKVLEIHPGRDSFLKLIYWDKFYIN